MQIGPAYAHHKILASAFDQSVIPISFITTTFPSTHPNGHLSKEWRTKQDYYIWQQKINTLNHTGAGWSLRTMMRLWTDSFTVWKPWNDAIHGHDLAT
jgi:hypothetical protein